MSHVCLASECSRNNFELLEREPCLLGELVLPLGVFGTAPCSKTSSYTPAAAYGRLLYNQMNKSINSCSSWLAYYGSKLVNSAITVAEHHTSKRWGPNLWSKRLTSWSFYWERKMEYNPVIIHCIITLSHMATVSLARRLNWPEVKGANLRVATAKKLTQCHGIQGSEPVKTVYPQAHREGAYSHKYRALLSSKRGRYYVTYCSE